MNRNKALTLLGTLAIILCIALPAEAAGPYRARGMGGPAAGDRLTGLRTLLQLDLSETQRTEIMKILDQYEVQLEGIRKRSFRAGKDLRKALRAEPNNEENLRTAYRALSSVREEHLVLGARMAAELKEVLTPEQRALLKTQRGQRLGSLRDHFERRAESEED